MKKFYTISKKIKPYKASKKERVIIKKHKGAFAYRPDSNEEIAVVNWYRYPSYDFIFGIPTIKNKYHKKEAAFFQFRDIRHKKVREGFYLDMGELKNMAEGWNNLLKINQQLNEKTL